jgi:membrane associated rhomboid family serine protease
VRVFPVKDDIPTDRWPMVTTALIVAYVVAAILTGDVGVLHLLVNCLFLWLFGPSVEDAMGRVRFLAFFVAGGLIATGVELGLDMDAGVLVVGTTGAISAVIGGYLRLYPWGKILTIVFLLFFFTIIEIPIAILIGAWIALQVVFGVVDPGDVDAALVGGLVFGLAVAPLVAPHVKTRDGLLRRGTAALS